MGGGHGPHIEPNPQNLQEDDACLSAKIRPIELVKHNPQLFHMDFWNLHNMYEILGGSKSMFFGLIGGSIATQYFLEKRATLPYNYYTNIHMGMLRFAFGFTLGVGFGYIKWGDRQKLHNAYTAERLRRRYPESMSLTTTDLWKYKYVEASHPFYGWK